MRIEQFYNSIGLFVGPSNNGFLSSTGYTFLTGFLQGTTGNYTGANSGWNMLNSLSRLQNLSTSYDLPKREMVQLGQMGAFSREIIDPPVVKMSFNYLLTNGVNEYRLGFPINGSTAFLSGILSSNSSDMSYYQMIQNEGVDADGATNILGVWTEAIGNGYISEIGFKAAVGGVAEGSVSIEGANYYVYSGVSGFIPSVDPVLGTPNTTWQFALPLPETGQDTLSNQPTVLKYGDITLNMGSLTGTNAGPGVLWNNDIYGDSACHLQSFDISVPLNLEAINELGSKFPYARRPRPPINIKLKISAIMADYQTGNLANYLAQCGGQEFPIYINFNSCSGTVKANVMNFQFNGASLDSQDFSVAIGNKKMVNASFTIPVGAYNDPTHNFFFSGSHIVQTTLGYSY